MNLRSELSLRIISGTVLAVSALFITWWHPISFAMLCLLAGYILTREWRMLTRGRSNWFLPLGALYIGSAIASLIYLRNIDAMVIFGLFALVWAGDIGGYIFGKLIGKHKIAPSISPGKSWEGLVGSIIATMYVYSVLGASLEAMLVIAPAISIIGLCGDLFESSLKRRAGVKDSGTLIPGHGGLFDRVDALIPCSIFAGIYGLIIMNGMPT